MSIVKLNNGQALDNLQDYQVGEMVKANLPPQTYTSISVKSVKHRFPATMNEVVTRQIILEISRLGTVWKSFKAFLKSIMGQYQNITVNKQQILEQLVGHNCSETKLKEVKTAFEECYTITLFVSNDCNHCELELNQSRFYLIAMHTGRLVPFFMSNVLPLAEQVRRG